jgi:type II secretory pathway pseudopilin PulG
MHKMIDFSFIPGLRVKLIRRLTRRRGIGLVETLVAIGILGVGVTAFVTDLSAGSIAVRVQNETTLAQGLAQTQMEVIKAAPYDKTGRSYPTVDSPDGYTISIASAPVEGNENQKQIQHVSITIRHNENAILTLEGYKVNR